MFYPVQLETGPAYLHFNEQVQLYSSDSIVLKNIPLEYIAEFESLADSYFRISLTTGKLIEFQSQWQREIKDMLTDSACTPLAYDACVGAAESRIVITENEFVLGSFRSQISAIQSYSCGYGNITLRLDKRILQIESSTECIKALEHAILVQAQKNAVTGRVEVEISAQSSHAEDTEVRQKHNEHAVKEAPLARYPLVPRPVNSSNDILKRLLTEQYKDINLDGSEHEVENKWIERSFGDATELEETINNATGKASDFNASSTVRLNELCQTNPAEELGGNTVNMDASRFWKTQYLDSQPIQDSSIEVNVIPEREYPFFQTQSFSSETAVRSDSGKKQPAAPVKLRETHFSEEYEEYEDFESYGCEFAPKLEDPTSKTNPVEQQACSQSLELVSSVISKAQDRTSESVQAIPKGIMALSPQLSQEMSSFTEDSFDSAVYEQYYQPCRVELIAPSKATYMYIELAKNSQDCEFLLSSASNMSKVVVITAERFEFCELVAGTEYFAEANLKDPEKLRRNCILFYNGPCIYLRGTCEGKRNCWLFACAQEWGIQIKRIVNARYIIE